MNKAQTFRTLELSEGELELVDREVVASNEPQLIMKPRLVGICRSDIKELLGTRTIRHDFGHEILAEVIAGNVKSSYVPSVGDFVVLDPHIEIQRTSGFGELIIASGSEENLAEAFIKVPTSIIDDRLIFTEPLACAHQCVSNLLRFEQKESLEGLSVGIVGAGMTGTLIGLLCKHYGATVTIINRSEERLHFLESTSIFSASELGFNDSIECEFDAVIPTTTFLFPEVLKFCEKIVIDAGLILLYGGTKAGDTFSGIEEVNIDSIRRSQSSVGVITNSKKFRVCGTHGAATEDFKAVIEIFETFPHDLPVEKLISKRIRLDQVPETIIEMTKKEILGKTLVEF
jgi:threonine dehydrogenase-like Zn-dependent dehydrogenase